MKVRNKKIIILASILSVLLIASSLAILTSSRDKKNIFTAGTCNVEIWEAIDINSDDTVDSFTNISKELTTNGEIFNSSNGTQTVSNIIPGQTIKDTVWIKNTGLSSCKVFVVVGVPTFLVEDGEVTHYSLNKDTNKIESDGSVAITEETPILRLRSKSSDGSGYLTWSPSDWVIMDNFIDAQYRGFGEYSELCPYGSKRFYLLGYNKTLAPGDVTSSIYDAITANLDVTSFTATLATVEKKVSISAYAVQSDSTEATSLEDFWEIFKNQTGWTFGSSIVEFTDSVNGLHTYIKSSPGSEITIPETPAYHYNAYHLKDDTETLYRPGDTYVVQSSGITSFAACTSTENAAVYYFVDDGNTSSYVFNVGETFIAPVLANGYEFYCSDTSTKIQSGEKITVGASGTFTFEKRQKENRTIIFKYVSGADVMSAKYTLISDTEFVVPGCFGNGDFCWKANNNHILYAGDIITITEDVQDEYIEVIDDGGAD